jgi:hypothetical protein
LIRKNIVGSIKWVLPKASRMKLGVIENYGPHMKLHSESAYIL